MTNVLKFPKPSSITQEDTRGPAHQVGAASGASSAMTALWLLTVLVWPILKWVIALDCVYQLARAIYYSGAPGIYAGLGFVLHFAVLTALTYFVSCYKPRGL